MFNGKKLFSKQQLLVLKRPLSQSDTVQHISYKSAIQLKTSATEARYSSRHQKQKRDTAQDIRHRRVIQLKISATEARYSSRHQQRKRDTAQDISHRSVISPKTSATTSPLHRCIFPFMNISCVFRNFWAFSVGDPLFVKSPFFSASCGHILLHKHKLLFWFISSFFRRGRPVKTLYFSPSCAHTPLYKHKLLISSFFTLFRRGPPINFSTKPFFFPFMRTFSPSYTQVQFSWFSSLFCKDPLSILVKTHYFPPPCADISLHTHKLHFSWLSSLSRRGLLAVLVKPPCFSFIGAYSPSKTHVASSVIYQPFFFSQKPSLVLSMCTFSPS